MPGTLLKLDDVTFGFGEHILFDRLRENILPGERLALLGRSGVGKSTLLRLIGGLLEPRSGRISWQGGGSLMGTGSRVGFVFQDHALLPWMSARENIRLAFRFLGKSGVTPGRQAARIEEISERLSITSLLDSYPHQLSGGMRQRVALARALVTDPQLLCLDEPFSALDLVLRREARETVETAIRMSGAATVMVTHDIGDAMAIAERVWLLRKEGTRTVIRKIVPADSEWCEEGLLAAYN